MNTKMVLAALMLATVALAGCVSDDDPDGGVVQNETFNSDTGLFEHDTESVTVHFAPGAWSTVQAKEEATIGFPAGTLAVEGERLVAVTERTASAGEAIAFLPSPGTPNLVLILNDEETTFEGDADADHARFLDGKQIVDWLQLFADEYPNRWVSTDNYYAAGEWLQEQFVAFGMDEVVYDEYDTNDLPQENCVSTGGVFQGNSEICPSSIANVVATQTGNDPDAGIIVIGGHYDIVGDTREGAYDNTGGALTVLAIAQALAPYEFDQTIIYALWAGEETGLQGSKSWVATHPELKTDINVYWNYDVVGGSWPSPLGEPTPLHFQYGPDNPNPNQLDERAPDQDPVDPVEEYMRAWAMDVVGWTGYPNEAFDYQGVVEDVSTSDHAAFTSEGIPVYNPNSSPEVNRVVQPHTLVDNLVVFSNYALVGLDTVPEETNWNGPEVERDAKEALARSFDPYTWIFLYHLVMSESEEFEPFNAA